MNKTYEQYFQFVKKFNALHREAAKIPLGEFAALNTPGSAGVKVMLFSPHPDDECVVGALPLRFLQECDAQVVNVGVTLGSNVNRKQGRLEELTKACATLGFKLIVPAEKGLDGVNLATREKNSQLWSANRKELTKILAKELPEIIFFPHANDFNSTHIGTNFLTMEAIQEVQKSNPAWQPLIVETEFWQMMDKPNLFVALKEEDEAKLIFALSAHKGEVERNPYHINHLARMLDNVTRGAEVVGGQGAKAPECQFAMLYCCWRVVKGKKRAPWDGGLMLGIDDSPKKIVNEGQLF